MRAPVLLLVFISAVEVGAELVDSTAGLRTKILPGLLNHSIQNATQSEKTLDGPYYENPFDVAQCSPTEANITINGLPGAICSPPCIDMECPNGPGGIAARASCALQAGSGEQYCALLCDPEKSFDSQCGDSASCKPLVGIGICTYDGP